MKTRIACIPVLLGIASATLAQDIPEDLIVGGSYMVHANGEEGLAEAIEALQTYIANPEDIIVTPLLAESNIYHIVVPEFDSFIDDSIEMELINLTSVDDGPLEWYEPDYKLGVDQDNEGQSGSLWVSGLGLSSADYKSQYAFNHLKLDAAHTKSQGEGVSIAILDTKPDRTHPQIGNILKMIDLVDIGDSGSGSRTGGGLSGNGLDEDGDGYIDEALGHGTFVTALVQSVAPKAGIVSIVVLNDDGVGSAATLALGISLALNEGAHIISLSLGSDNESLAVSSVIEYAIESGVSVFASVGNTGDWGCLFPARHPDVTAVGASNADMTLANISSYNLELDLVAPGLSNMISGPGDTSRLLIGPTLGTEYVAGSGTSFSTALAAGAGALIRAQLVNLNTEQVSLGQIGSRIRKRLKQSPTKVDLPNGFGEIRALLDTDDATEYSDPVPEDSDINGDGVTDGADLAMVLGRWGLLLNSSGLHREDIERDGVVDGQDLARLLGGWGTQ